MSGNTTIRYLLLAAAVVIVLALVFSVPTPERKKAVVSFNVDFPRTISMGVEKKAYVDLTCRDADANLVSVLVSCQALVASSDQKGVIRVGTTERIVVAVNGKDVADAKYPVSIQVQYSDDFGTHRTEAWTGYITLLPSIEFSDVNWMLTIWQPFGKNRISQNDNTELSVKVRSKHRNATVIYTGLEVRVELLAAQNIGVSIDPTTQRIQPLGPLAESQNYKFKLESKNAVVGVYQLKLSLYSKDGELVAELPPKDFTITP